MCPTVSHQFEIHAPSRNGRLIVFRFLTKEILLVTVAVTLVLMFIVMGTQTIAQLSSAAAGQISNEVVFDLVINKAPFFLQVILPLGFLLSVLLVQGRMHVESEMVVLRATGLSNWGLLGYTLFPSILVAAIVAIVSLYLTPAGIHEVKRIVLEQKNRSSLEILTPGVFQTYSSSSDVTYIQEVASDGKIIAPFLSSVSETGRPFILVAENARKSNAYLGNDFLIFENGYRYDFSQINSLSQEISFKEYGLELSNSDYTPNISHLDAIPTHLLISGYAQDVSYQGRLVWRLTLPLVPIIVAVFAVQLARTSPRQGRFAKLIPAIILYQVYITLLMESRSSVEAGDIGVWSFMLVHLTILGIGLSMVFNESFWERFFQGLPKISKRFYLKANV
jgi:lipopolysaccharide export system permease protein